VVSAILGVKNREQIEENYSAMARLSSR